MWNLCWRQNVSSIFLQPELRHSLLKGEQCVLTSFGKKFRLEKKWEEKKKNTDEYLYTRSNEIPDQFLQKLKHFKCENNL